LCGASQTFVGKILLEQFQCEGQATFIGRKRVKPFCSGRRAAREEKSKKSDNKQKGYSPE